MSPNTRRKWTLPVVAKHIQLYVNDYTLALDERAVHALLDWQRQQGGTVRRFVLVPVFV